MASGVLKHTSDKVASAHRGILNQIHLLCIVGLVISSVITYFVMYNMSEIGVEEQIEKTATDISDELIDSVKEFPSYRWLLNYWYEHPDDMNIEYDVDYWTDTVTEHKLGYLYQHNPSFLVEYAMPIEVEHLSPEDQKLFAEITYTWMTNRIDQIKRNYGVDYLYIVSTDTDAGDNPYGTQFFLLAGAERFASRGLGSEDIYVLGKVVEIEEGGYLSNAMRAAVENAHLSLGSDSADKQKSTMYVGTGTDYVDYYAYLDEINDQAVLVGITVNVRSMRQQITTEAIKRTLLALTLQVLLLLLILRRLRAFMINPLKKVTDNIRLYTTTKDSDLVTRNLTEMYEQNAEVRNNEIGGLTDDIITLVDEIDDYVSEIENITIERERMSAELGLASNIQAGMLPNIFPPFPDQSEFDLLAYMDPAREVGGDFYDFFMIDDDHLAIEIADVSGKGVPAALFMMAQMIMIRDKAMTEANPAKVLEDVNTTVCAGNNEDMFLTVWLGVLEISTGKLVAANAGHEYPVIKRPDGHFELLKDKHGFVLGALKGVKYTDYEIQLEPGSKLFVYTDGLPEATNGDSELFGIDRMVKALRENEDKPLDELFDAIKESVVQFVGDAEQFDDLTMLCIEYLGPQE